jgi:ligand-binding sensor domain-containing protein
MKSHRIALAFLAVLLGGALPLRASDGQPNGYALTAWTKERGLPPGDVLVMTQDLDGYLWVGTTTGLARFDGLQFALWGAHGEPALPVRSVPALTGAHDGSLWIGFGSPGGVSRYRNGQLVLLRDRRLPHGGSRSSRIARRSGRAARAGCLASSAIAETDGRRRQPAATEISKIARRVVGRQRRVCIAHVDVQHRGCRRDVPEASPDKPARSG